MPDYTNITPRELAESYLTVEEVAAVNLPLEDASVLPLRVYTSKPFFEREADAVLRPGWHALARIDQLQEQGSYVTGTILGEPVLVLRDRANTIRAMSNVCRHRGTQLLTDCGVAKAIVCPYHTWTYNLDGSLRGAPHMNKINGFDKSAVKLPEFKVEIWNGFVFVSLDADPAPLGEQITELTRTLSPFKLETWRTFPYMEKEFDWNWKISLENFTEAYHHVGIHQHTIGKISPAEKAKYEITNDNYSLFYVNIEGADGDFLPEDMMNYPFPTVDDLPEFFVRNGPIVNIYPTFHLVMGANFVLWLQFEITGAQSHRLIWRWLVPPRGAVLPDVQERLDALDAMIRPVLDEDIAFLPRIKAAVNSQAFVPGRYCDQERAVHQMHRWLLRKMAENDALFCPG